MRTYATIIFAAATIFIISGCTPIQRDWGSSSDKGNSGQNNSKTNRYSKDTTGENEQNSRINQSTESSSFSNREKLMFEIMKFINAPYVYGGNSKAGTDCSGFTSMVYSASYGIKLKRTADAQFKQGVEINLSEAKFGDLLFFDTQNEVKPGHVAIYLDDSTFVHSIPKHGVSLDSFRNSYYKTRYMGARRVIF